MKTKHTCPKCSGKGTISGFGHIANGLCFRCKGAGFILCEVSPVPAASEYEKSLAEKCLSTNLETFAGMTFGQLSKLDSFAHSGFTSAKFPGLLEIWQENGRKVFFAKQKEKLDQFHTTRGW